MSNLYISACIFFNIILFSLSFAENNFHKTMILEYLFSSASEIQYKELIKNRTYDSYEGAIWIMNIENHFDRYANLGYSEYIDKMRSIDVELYNVTKNIQYTPLDSFRIKEWAYIHWLLRNDEMVRLNKIFDRFENTDQIWKPVLIEKTSDGLDLEYYVSTQFWFSRYFRLP